MRQLLACASPPCFRSCSCCLQWRPARAPTAGRVRCGWWPRSLPAWDWDWACSASAFSKLLLVAVLPICGCIICRRAGPPEAGAEPGLDQHHDLCAVLRCAALCYAASRCCADALPSARLARRERRCAVLHGGGGRTRALLPLLARAGPALAEPLLPGAPAQTTSMAPGTRQSTSTRPGRTHWCALLSPAVLVSKTQPLHAFRAGPGLAPGLSDRPSTRVAAGRHAGHCHCAGLLHVLWSAPQVRQGCAALAGLGFAAGRMQERQKE